MGTNTIVYLFFIIISSVLLYKLYTATIKTKPSDNSGGSGGSTTIECGLLNPKTIQKCTTDNNTCGNCRCSDDPSVRLGCMSCQETDGQNLDIPQNQCVGDNVSWINDINGGHCELLKGSYCLPTTMNQPDCNPQSGRSILAQQNDTYYWKCVCLRDNMIGNGGSGNCSHVYECGMEGSSTSPGPYGRYLRNIHDKTPWNAETSNWNPFPGSPDAECVCGPGEVANNKNLTCMPDSCTPGKSIPGSSDSCDCHISGNINMIDCSGISNRTDGMGINYYTGSCAIPSCVPDPCATDGNPLNFYDPHNNMCSCDYKNNYWRTYTTNTIGETCTNLCANNAHAVVQKELLDIEEIVIHQDHHQIIFGKLIVKLNRP
jgi:hypothetical protein